MATPTRVQTPVDERCSHEQLIRAYRVMYMSRRLDDREILLKRQNRIFFQISGAGHEAMQAAAGLVLRPGARLVLSLLSRPRAGAGAGRDGRADAAAGGGRGRRSGFRRPADAVALDRCRAAHRHRGSSATGTQYLQAAGCAQAYRYLDPDSDEVTLVSSGEGATSEGEFWEAINAACLENLPLVFLIEDNGYAISVPVERQTAGGNISQAGVWLPEL